MSTDAEARTESPGVRKQSITLIFIALMLAMLLASLSQMVFSSALPTVVGELDGVDHMTWVITAYMLASTVTMPVYGKISDFVGRKPLLIVAILVFVAGSIVGGLSENMLALTAGRTVQGVGGGGLIILSQAAIADVVPARQRGKYVGILGGVFAVSSVAGPVLGGWLTEGPGWRWAFWLNIPLGLVAVVGVSVLLHLPKRPRRAEGSKTDYLGMAVLAAATTMVVLIGTWGGSTYGWGSPQILGLAGGAVVALALFVVVELRADEPVMPMAMFKERNFSLTTTAAPLIAIIMFGAMSYIPTYFQMAEGLGAMNAGLLMTPLMATMIITSIVLGQLITKTGRYKSLPIIGALVLALGVGLLSTTSLETPVALICVYLALMGIGLGASMQILTLVVQNSFPHAMVGTATAGNNYFRQVGGSMGAAVVGSIFAARLTSAIAERLPQGAGGVDGARSLTPELVSSLPDAARIPIIESYNDALIPIFAFMVPLALVAALVLSFVKEIPLAEEIEHEVVPQSFGEGEISAFGEGEISAFGADDDEPRTRA